MSKKYLPCKRFNPTTGGYDYFFPMELDDGNSDWGKVYGYEVGMALLGDRHFPAIFVPCLNRTVNRFGLEEMVETSSEEQHQIFLAYIRDELREQAQKAQDGRCQIPDGRGGTKVCPCRVRNPHYTSGGNQPKTLPVKCEGCMYYPFKEERTRFNLSALDHENENGEVLAFEVKAPDSYYQGDRYMKLRAEYIHYVRESYPKLATLAELLVDEFTRSEAARALGLATSTVAYQTEKLKKLLIEFLDSVAGLY